MKLTQEFKSDFSSFLLKIFIIVWCSSLCISIGGLSMQLYTDFNTYIIFSMLMIGCAVIIMFGLVILLISMFIIESIDTYTKFKKYAFEKEDNDKI